MKAAGVRMVAVAILVFTLGGCDGTGTDDVSSSGAMSAVMISDEVRADAASPATEIDLSAAANVYALANAGSPVLGGGIDGFGYAYAENLSGPTISWNNATFSLGAP
ncbi:MAG TPA: hypothetical protein VMG11_04510, partial [Steroidobacteraceae bacterium]|nr:hypothetical protein [Steroidobacteraceae bacterium]